jgi:hypothetical protein
MKLIRYLFWNLVYLFDYRKSVTVNDWIKRFKRTRNPFRKFKPSVYFNEGLNEWQVYLKDCRSITWPLRNVTLSLNIMVDSDSGEIVGFDLFKKELERVLRIERDKYGA